MNEISILTREMVTEYETLVGRKISPSEYLGFRTQAINELNAGYGKQITQNIDATVPAKTMITNNYQETVVPNKETQTISQIIPIQAEVQHNEPANVVNQAVNKQPVADNVNQITNVSNQIIKPAVVTNTNNNKKNNNTFFAMIDNLSV